MPASSSGGRGASTMAERKAARESRRNTGERRLSRNESEKLRRDKLNMHIAELAKLVPTVASAPRKLDKSSILRLSVNYLRMHYELKKAKAFEKWRPSFLTEENLGEMLLEAYDGFLLVVSQKGDILYVSDMVTPLLGHSQVELLGQSVYQLVHPEDVALCQDQFSADRKAPDLEGAAGNAASEPSTVRKEYPVLTNGRRSFHVRMLNLHKKDQRSYELVHLACHVRTVHQAVGQGSNTVIMGVARLARHESVRQLNVVAADAREFTTQHDLQGNIMYADQRHALINGRMAHEVFGKSPYTFIPAEDLPPVKFSHYKIMLSGVVDSTVFRLYTNSGEIIFVESRSSVCCDNWTKEPKFILSNNVLISEELFWVLMGKQRAEMLAFQESNDVPVAKGDVTDSGVTEVSSSADNATVGHSDKTANKDSQEEEYLNEDCASFPSAGSGPNSFGPDSCTSSLDSSEADVTESGQIQTEQVKQGAAQDRVDRGMFTSVKQYAAQDPVDRGMFTSLKQYAAQDPVDRGMFTSELQEEIETENNGEFQHKVSSSHLHITEKEQEDVKMTLIQGQLAEQLERKYRQLERSLQRQGLELSMLGDNLRRHLVRHPEAQQAYLQRLQLLEQLCLANPKSAYVEESGHNWMLPVAEK